MLTLSAISFERTTNSTVDVASVPSSAVTLKVNTLSSRETFTLALSARLYSQRLFKSCVLVNSRYCDVVRVAFSSRTSTPFTLLTLSATSFERTTNSMVDVASVPSSAVTLKVNTLSLREIVRLALSASVYSQMLNRS